MEGKMAYDIECPYCHKNIASTMFDDHFNECEPKECLYGCPEKFPLKELKEHHQTCPLRFNFATGSDFPGQVNAENPSVDDLSDDEILDDCPWYCGQKFSRKEMPLHASICDNAQDYCPDNCGFSGTRAELVIHKPACPAQNHTLNVLQDPLMSVSQEMCLNCSKILPQSQITEHQKDCFAKKKFAEITPNTKLMRDQKVTSRKSNNTNPLVDGIIYDDYYSSTEDDSDEEVEENKNRKESKTFKQKDILRNDTHHTSSENDSDGEDIPNWKPRSSKKKGVFRNGTYHKSARDDSDEENTRHWKPGNSKQKGVFQNDTYHKSRKDDSDEEDTHRWKSENSKQKGMFRNPHHFSVENDSDHEDIHPRKPETSKQKTSDANVNTKKNVSSDDFFNKKHDPTIDLEAHLFESITNRSQQKTSFFNDERENDDEMSSDEDAKQTLEDLWAEAEVILKRRLIELQAMKKVSGKKNSNFISRSAY